MLPNTAPRQEGKKPIEEADPHLQQGLLPLSHTEGRQGSCQCFAEWAVTNTSCSSTWVHFKSHHQSHTATSTPDTFTYITTCRCLATLELWAPLHSAEQKEWNGEFLQRWWLQQRRITSVLIWRSHKEYTGSVIPTSGAVLPHGTWRKRQLYLWKTIFSLSAVSPFDVKKQVKASSLV